MRGGVRYYVLDLSGAGPGNPPKLCKEVVGCVQKGKTTPCLSSDERYHIPCYDRKSPFRKKTSTTEQCEKIVNERYLKGTNKVCNSAAPECVRNDDSEPCKPICVNKSEGKTCSSGSPPDCVKVGTGEPCKVFCTVKSTKSTCPDIFSPDCVKSDVKECTRCKNKDTGKPFDDFTLACRDKNYVNALC